MWYVSGHAAAIAFSCTVLCVCDQGSVASSERWRQGKAMHGTGRDPLRVRGCPAHTGGLVPPIRTLASCPCTVLGDLHWLFSFCVATALPDACVSAALAMRSQPREHHGIAAAEAHSIKKKIPRMTSFLDHGFIRGSRYAFSSLSASEVFIPAQYFHSPVTLRAICSMVCPSGKTQYPT